MATMTTVTSELRDAAAHLLWTGWARVRGVTCDLELTRNGYTLHMAQGEAWFEAHALDCEEMDLGDMALVLAQGLAALSV